MELPQSRPLQTKGGKATHDFLSLYASSPSNQDPTPPQGSFVVTHDFLQPLERVGPTDREDNFAGMAAVGNRPPWPAECGTMDPLLPGAIGGYNISYIGQRVSETERNGMLAARTSSAHENDESIFRRWDEYAIVKGKTGKENAATSRSNLPGMDMVGGEWTSSVLERTSWSSSNQKNTIAPLSSVSSLPPLPSKKKQSFIEIITAAKSSQGEDEDDMVIKSDTPSHSPLKGSVSLKLENKALNQKSNTIRSKHSATEQRRRSKINDRFQKLREVIPNSEQKKDKASFLLEVIEYIQFLQDRVNRYESPYNIWKHEPAKMMQWKNDHIANKQGADTDSGPVLAPAMTFDGNKAVLSPGIPSIGQNLSDSDLTTAKTKEGGQLVPASALNGTESPTTINAFSYVAAATSSDADKTMKWNPLQSQQMRSSGPEDMSSMVDRKMNDHQGQQSTESGTASISSIYSQGLVNNIAQALQRSGINLSQSRVSVKINLGKRANGSIHCSTSTAKENHVAAKSTGEDMRFASKKQKRKAEGE